ncbi:NAD-dependent epimerase/dehydratase family protein [Rhodocista pekingensis]|uniref:NAD-dependent epimerase/dehydratase family protein n=1 Tax=Rhodocista pekingensis TaxID=201185 RepID=A0ABW2KYW3_9PROT
MKVLVTGVAGFIGFHLAQLLLDRGDTVVGVDNLNDYYATALKEDRLARLRQREGFHFQRLNIADRDGMAALAAAHPDIGAIAHLAAQAGVRYSLTNPFAYVESNLMGHVVVLETARRLEGLRHLVYASSSSVYGLSEAHPFSLDDRADRPASLYGATKRADELISHSYSHIHRIPQTGLRFFTVYGPWGRPDMALFLFTRAILAGEPIELFNEGRLQRDFTYIDDIVAGVVRAIDRPPAVEDGAVPHRVFNLGNNTPVELERFVAVLEDALGVKARRHLAPMQPGDVLATHADIAESRRMLGFEPSTPIEVGIPRFVDWYRTYYRV